MTLSLSYPRLQVESLAMPIPTVLVVIFFSATILTLCNASLLGLQRVHKYSSTTLVINYYSNFTNRVYSKLSISGYHFHFR